VSIHPTAAVSAEARIAPSAEVGPYCAIIGDVEIGEHTVLESHCRVGSRFGSVVVGAHNYIQSGAALGGPPQDLSYEEGRTELVIGDHNRIGEYTTVHLGSSKGEGVTRIGDRNFIMAYVHIAHDCVLADDIVLTNSAQLGGHVTVAQRAVVGGVAIVTQLVRIGELSFIAAGSFVNKDILPFVIAEGHWATMRAVNRVGLSRAGFEPEAVRNIARAVRPLLSASLTVAEALAAIESDCTPCHEIEQLVDFARTSKKGLARG
jgi:UDP-N-acetylglucosamine acyltransferase